MLSWRKQIIMSVCLTLNEVTKDAMFRGTEILRKCVLRLSVQPRMPSVSTLLHELVKLILDFYSQDLMGLGGESHFLKDV